MRYTIQTLSVLAQLFSDQPAAAATALSSTSPRTSFSTTKVPERCRESNMPMAIEKRRTPPAPNPPKLVQRRAARVQKTRNTRNTRNTDRAGSPRRSTRIAKLRNKAGYPIDLYLWWVDRVSRGGGDVGHAGKFVTSIAVQLARSVPALQQHVYNAVKERGVFGVLYVLVFPLAPIGRLLVPPRAPREPATSLWLREQGFTHPLSLEVLLQAAQTG
ncbi:hypothetical protein PSPO01_15936 [Paraphaeosphaeria sporulosa]